MTKNGHFSLKPLEHGAKIPSLERKYHALDVANNMREGFLQIITPSITMIITLQLVHLQNEIHQS